MSIPREVDGAETRSRSLFWPIQTIGWAIYFAANLFEMAGHGWLQPPCIYGYAVTALAGFGITAVIRAIWKPRLTTSRNLGQTAAGALLTSLLAAFVLLAAISLPRWLAWPYTRLVGPSAFGTYGEQFYWAFFLFLAWELFYLGYYYWRAEADRRTQTARALAVSESAKLQQLRFRINPAFLFDSLEALRARIAIDPPAARELVAELAAFLRYGLLHPLLSPVPLEEEFQAVRHYLAVRDIGFGGSDRSEASITAGEKLRTIPAFLLLLLVEKALILASAGGPVRLRVILIPQADPRRIRIKAVCGAFPAKAAVPSPRSPVLDFTADFLRHLAESHAGRFVFGEARRAGETAAILDIDDTRP